MRHPYLKIQSWSSILNVIDDQDASDSDDMTIEVENNTEPESNDVESNTESKINLIKIGTIVASNGFDISSLSIKNKTWSTILIWNIQVPLNSGNQQYIFPRKKKNLKS